MLAANEREYLEAMQDVSTFRRLERVTHPGAPLDTSDDSLAWLLLQGRRAYNAAIREVRADGDIEMREPDVPDLVITPELLVYHHISMSEQYQAVASYMFYEEVAEMAPMDTGEPADDEEIPELVDPPGGW